MGEGAEACLEMKIKLRKTWMEQKTEVKEFIVGSLEQSA